ncbi:MAG: hypothetical protein IPL75_03825 [Acidobacteria bacterium]|nr:hypothetical protein [Acidobacteriota bacterium]
MPPRVISMIGSAELGLAPGSVAEADACLSLLPRDQVIPRIIWILHALSSDRGGTRVNQSYLAQTHQASLHTGDLTRQLMRPNDVFLEPSQQLALLRRAFAVCPEVAPLSLATKQGFQAFFDASRYCADVVRGYEPTSDSGSSVDAWLTVAAGLMPRLWLSQPANVNITAARTRLMLATAETSAALTARAENLLARFPDAIGLTFDQLTILTLFTAYWSGTVTFEELEADPNRILINPSGWLRNTVLTPTIFEAFSPGPLEIGSEVLATSDGASKTSEDALPGSTIG